MKIFDLFEGYPQIEYRADEKVMVGDVKLWLKEFGASQTDINAAIKTAKASPEFKAILDVPGVVYTGTATTEKNGTLRFTYKRKDKEKMPHRFNIGYTNYVIYGNGQLRSEQAIDAKGKPHHAQSRTRLRSSEPKIKDSPKETLDGVYSAALANLQKTMKRIKI